MFLYSKLKDYNKTIHIAFIGCGKFVSMFLAQLNNLVKIEIIYSREYQFKLLY